MSDKPLPPPEAAKPIRDQWVADTKAKARAHPDGPREGLERGHIGAMVAAGCTREDVQKVLDDLFPGRAGRQLTSILDSFGPWAS